MSRVYYDELIADVLFKHLPMKRLNPRHPTIIACAREIEAVLAAALTPPAPHHPGSTIMTEEIK